MTLLGNAEAIFGTNGNDGADSNSSCLHSRRSGSPNRSMFKIFAVVDDEETLDFNLRWRLKVVAWHTTA